MKEIKEKEEVLKNLAKAIQDSDEALLKSSLAKADQVPTIYLSFYIFWFVISL